MLEKSTIRRLPAKGREANHWVQEWPRSGPPLPWGWHPPGAPLRDPLPAGASGKITITSWGRSGCISGPFSGDQKGVGRFSGPDGGWPQVTASFELTKEQIYPPKKKGGDAGQEERPTGPPSPSLEKKARALPVGGGGAARFLRGPGAPGGRRFSRRCPPA